MQLAVTAFPAQNYFHEIAEQLAEQNLVYYASEAAETMQFDTQQELTDSVKRAMEICIAIGLPIRSNFKRIFKCTTYGLVYDWKLSVLAYNLVRMNGDASNPRVAALQIKLLKKI